MKRRFSNFDDSDSKRKKTNYNDVDYRFMNNDTKSEIRPPFRFNKNHSNNIQKNQIKTNNNINDNITNNHSKDDFQKMSTLIYEYFLQNSQSYECYQKKQELRDALYAIFQDIIPYLGVYIVGSSANGFGTNKSDVDMCLMVSHEEIEQRTEAILLLKIFSKSLRKAGFIRHLQVIHAKVPIIKFHDCINKIECDLNINNHNGIRNTHLLKYYSETDWRVKPLVIIIKRWAKFHDINDAAKQTISSYSLVLMTLFYLQYACKPSVVPVLQQLYPDKFNVKSEVKELDLNEKLDEWKSENKESLGELFIGFLKFYNNFDYRNNVISVRTGKLIPVSNYLRNHEEGSHNQWKFLCIEEPFELTNTARSVYDYYVFQRILRVFKKSFQIIEETKNLDNLFYEQVDENN